MTLSEFATLVQAMRDAQTQWFAGHKTRTHFEKCKDLEKKVDSELLLIKGRQGVQTAFEFGFDDYEG